MNADDREGHDKSLDALKAEHQKPEDRTLPTRWQDLVDDDDTQPAPTLMSILSNQAFVQMQQATMAGQAGAIERQNMRIAELETAIEAMVQAAYGVYPVDSQMAANALANIVGIGREALGK